jgi:hypothetical protein
MFRVSTKRSGKAVVLRDGARIEPHHHVLELHFWNEQLPRIRQDGLRFAWAVHARGRFNASLAMLAESIEKERRYADVRALQATLTLPLAYRADRVIRFTERLGFTCIPLDRRPLRRRIHDLLEDFLILGLAWTFNPGSLRNRGVFRRRIELWMSRSLLMARYGRSQASASRTSFARSARV